jgi:DNA invertase Pin-like site-specific DNA recombinase
MMKSVIGYARVSTKRQADEGASLSDQRLQIREFAKRNKLKIRKIYSDVDSARNEDGGCERPGFNEAVERSLKTKWPIIAASADRFTRTGATYDRFVAEGGSAYGAREGFGVDDSVSISAEI